MALGAARARVIDTPGHTRGHIAFHFAEGGVLACGDTLFSLGCGRLIEGSAEEMFASLAKLAALPDETLVCCGHEYTEQNGRFALSVDPANPALLRRMEEVHRLRAAKDVFRGWRRAPKRTVLTARLKEKSGRKPEERVRCRRLLAHASRNEKFSCTETPP